MEKKNVEGATSVPINSLIPGSNYAFHVRSFCVDEELVSTLSDNYNFSTPLRIGDLTAGIGMRIYPNPITKSATAEITIPNDFILIPSADIQLNIYDLLGNLVDSYSNIDISNTGETIRFNIYKRNLAAGIYSPQLKYGVVEMGKIKLVIE